MRNYLCRGRWTPGGAVVQSQATIRLCCDSVGANYGTVALWWVDACRESAAYSAAE